MPPPSRAGAHKPRTVPTLWPERRACNGSKSLRLSASYVRSAHTGDLGPRLRCARRDGSLDHRRHQRPRAGAARERDAVRRHQDGLVLAGPGPRAAGHRGHRHRRDRLPRLLHLLRGVEPPHLAGGVRPLRAPGGEARLGPGRRAHRLGGPHEGARLHPRERARGPAHALRRGARGGALSVDGGRAHPGQVRRRDRRGGAAHRGAEGVRRRRAQLPGAHGVAGGRRDRERPALRGDPPPGRVAHHAHPVEPGARRGHAARGPLRRGHARPAGAAGRRRLPGLPPRRRQRRAAPGRLRSSGHLGGEPASGRGCARSRPDATGQRTRRPPGAARPLARPRRRRPAGGAARGRRRAARDPVLRRAGARVHARRTASCWTPWRTRRRWA